VSRTALEKIADREHAVTTTAEQVSAQIDTLTERLRELEAEAADLQVARKVILALGDDEPAGPRLPDCPVYQHILTALNDDTAPMRAKDLCHALDLGFEPTKIEAIRLVATGLVTEDEPGLFHPAATSLQRLTSDQPPSPNANDKTGITVRPALSEGI
jgi:hypothetical protein